MKEFLLQLLAKRDLRRATINNCVHLINREEDSLASRARSHSELLVRARNSALETAQCLEAALLAERHSHLAFLDVYSGIQQELRIIKRQLEDPKYAAYHAGLAMMRDRLQALLLDADQKNQARQLRDGA